MKNIKSFFLGLLSLAACSLSLVSCTDNFDENDNDSVVPASPKLGFWQSDYTDTYVADCNITFATTAEGDTIVEVTHTNKTNHRVDSYTGGKIESYDAANGILTINFDGFVQAGTKNAGTYLMYLVYESTGKHNRAFVKFYDASTGSMICSYTASPCKAPVYGGYWESVDGALVLNFSRGTVDAEGNQAYVANGTLDGAALTTGTWAEDGTTDMGITLKVNSRHETVAVYNGKEYVMHR